MGFTKQQQVILLLLGLAIFCIDLCRPFHPVWSIPYPASTNLTTQPSPQWIIEVTGAVTNLGIYVFHHPPTAKEAFQRAGGPTSQGCASSGQMYSPVRTGTRIDIGTSERRQDRVTVSPMDPAKKLVLGIPIPLNQADAEALAMIPGISERVAQRIVAFRDSNGPFRSFNDLDRVKGVGPKKLKQLSSYLVLE